VAEFNQRLRQAGEDENMVFNRWAEPRWLARTAESCIYNEFFVAADGGIAVAAVSDGPRGRQRRRMGRLEAVPGLSRSASAPTARSRVLPSRELRSQ
jgi:hypothetical protein